MWNCWKLISITYWDILSWIMLIIMWRPPSVRTRNLTYREEALDPLSVVHGERVRGGGGGEGELNWGQAADPLSHLGNISPEKIFQSIDVTSSPVGIGWPAQLKEREMKSLIWFFLFSLSLQQQTQRVISASSSSVTTINLRQTEIQIFQTIWNT